MMGQVDALHECADWLSLWPIEHSVRFEKVASRLFLLTLEVIPKSAVVKNVPAGTLLDALDILPIFPAFHQGAR
jgi:hypothetical protein